jgi:hypothetical protein
MIISHKYRFIFIKTIKTAGTSLEVYFSQFAGPLDVLTPIFPVEENHHSQNYRGWFNPFLESKKYGFSLKNRLKECLQGRRFYNHIPAYLAKERISPEIWNSYFKFSVERNPWDKAVSYYHMLNHRSGKIVDFEHFVSSNDHAYNFPLYTSFNSKEVLVDRILKYDQLDTDLSEVFGSLGVPFEGKLTTFSKANYRTDRKPYQEYYNSITKEIIRSKFKNEIDLMKFDF